MPVTKKNNEIILTTKGQSGLTKLLTSLLAKYFKFIILFLMAAVLLTGYLFILKPKQQAIVQGVDETIKQKQAENEDLNSYFTKLQRYIASYAAIGADKKKLADEMLPSGADPEKLFTSLEALINGQGLILNSIELAPDEKKTKNEAAAETPDTGIGEIKIVMEIVGTDYKSLKDLLSTLENNLNLLEVEKINWTPVSLSAIIEAKTYYVK